MTLESVGIHKSRKAMREGQTIPELGKARNAWPAVVCMLIALGISLPAEAQDPVRRSANASSANASEGGEADGLKIPSAWTFAWGEHPSLRFGKALRIDFKARIHSEVRGSDLMLDSGDASEFDSARRRIGVSGTIGDIAEFQVERELLDDEGWRDLYVNYRQFRAVELQAGQFKVPFGLDENTSSSKLDFVYRSQAARHLAPGRDRGVMAHGRVGVLRYSWGAFASEGERTQRIDLAQDDVDLDGVANGGSLMTAGRLIVQPFRASRSPFEDFQAGLAYTMSDVATGFVEFQGETPVGHSFLDSSLALQGARRRIGVEARWRPGPFSLQSEFMRLTSERREQSIYETDLPALVGSAWYVQGSWILTGERKIKGADSPRRPLFHGGVGSIELAARLEDVRFRSGVAGQPSIGPRAETIEPRGDRALTFGVNWWPNRWIKVQANVIRDAIAAPSTSSLTSTPASWSRVVRVGFSL